MQTTLTIAQTTYLTWDDVIGDGPGRPPDITVL